MMILRNKLFARKDYEGLPTEQAKILRERRDKYAKAIREERNRAQRNPEVAKNSSGKVVSKTVSGKYGGNSQINVSTKRKPGESIAELDKRHNKAVNTEMLKQSKLAKEDFKKGLRGEAEKRLKKLDASRESIAKHEKVAQALRKKKAKNMKIAGGLTVAGLGGYAYGASKHYRNKNK